MTNDAALAAVSSGFSGSVGFDLVDVRRFAHLTAVGGPRFLNRQFTPLEIDTCDGDSERLAARFAAKEAVAKSLGTGFRDGLAARHIEIVTCPTGCPAIVLNGPAVAAAAATGRDRFAVSLSHENGFAGAFVIAYSNKEAL
jgi:holo-[acyl-carrier protein] synthase